MFNFLIWILLIELAILVLFIIMSLFENIYLTSKKKKEEIQRKILTELFIECLEKKVLPIKVLSKSFKNPYLLLTVLEAFNLRFQGGYWILLKEALSTHFLLPLARKKYVSRSWSHRYHAARCFALCPLLGDLPFILPLMKDPLFLVHSAASLAAIRLEAFEGLSLMIEKISLAEDPYSKFFYKDLLLNGSTQVFQCIEKEALKETDERTHLTCMDILAAKVFPVAKELLQRDLASLNPKIRRAALKVYAHNPQKDSESVLLKAIHSSESEIREEAAFGLSLFSSEASLMALKKGLSDGCLAVRLQAAKSLKKNGVKGIAILNEQKDLKDPIAYEMANYVLEFS